MDTQKLKSENNDCRLTFPAKTNPNISIPYDQYDDNDDDDA